MLIQKDVKQVSFVHHPHNSLRALLIQKDVKQRASIVSRQVSLRALLIQKDVKLTIGEDCVIIV